MKTFLSLLMFLLIFTSEFKTQDIFESIKGNDLTDLKLIIEKDISLLIAKDNAGNTPLHNAAISGSVPITEFLLSKGADINSTNTTLSTPLHLAIFNGRDDAAKLLIEKGAGLNLIDSRGNTPLHIAALSNRYNIAELLILKGAELETRNQLNYTPLGQLTRSTHNFETAKVLVLNGADINAPWTDGSTPLNNAALYSDNRVIDLLLDHNADFDTSQENLSFMVFSAAEKGHVRLFRRILEKCGESILANEESNKYIMRNAIISASLDFVKLLISYNISLDISADVTGSTPLHSLARNPNALEMIEFLVQNGADINARTNDGRSSYNIAKENSNNEALTLIIRLGGNSEPQKFPVLTGPYMGQTPPGDKPELFAPGIVLLDHCTISFSKDGNEMYWADGNSILFSKLQNGQWTKPDFVSFSGPNELMFYDDVPFVSPDNKKLFFTSRRPIDSLTANTKKENIWFVERTAGGWSEPKPLNPEVNALALHWQVSVSNSGTIFFAGTDKDSYGSADIYCSIFEDGEYSKPVNLGPMINSAEGESMPYIAPDESYLIFYKIVIQRPSLFISYKAKDGQWLQPKKIDLFNRGCCGIVSPDGKYFFSYNRWVSAKFIDELRPKELL